MAIEIEQLKNERGVNEDAVKAYMLSQDESLLEVIENLKKNPNRVDINQII